MCELMTIMAVAGAAASAAGAGMGAAAQNSQLQFQAQVAKNNEKYSKWMAADAESRGSKEEDKQRERTGLIIGAQRASLGASGTDVNEGSALDLQVDAATLGEMDAITIRNNANREAWGHRVQASNFANEAKVAKSSQSSPWLAVGSSLLGSASQVGGTYMKASKPGGGVWF